MNTNHEYTNSLINSTSPYLLQHAHNPVDWHAWGDEAWNLAKETNRPVLVSIGYSSCHWCHVMEHESFEDVPTAEIMNRWFVNIKVDREERPDVDMVYMDACQVMTGRGGWPLNVICLPDKRPIFAGTYFPIESWQQVLMQIQALWANEPQKAIEYADNLEKGLQQMNLVEPGNSEKFSRKDIPAIYNQMSTQFDYEEGGPNRAPKFPMPNNYELLLDHHLTTGDKESLDFVHLTLLKMANGGINDQIRGGFCRYSTDKYWFAPHFEKMLYDNAQLAGLYARAFGITDLHLYKETVRNILHFCMAELRDPEGGYCAALDADTDGIEGRYYVFTDEELKNNLTEIEYPFAQLIFGATENGNWEHGYNILCWPYSIQEILEKTGYSMEYFIELFNSIQKKLIAVQADRTRPGLDNKIITAWNGLMLEGLSKAALNMHNHKWLTEAQRLADWLWNHVQCEGKLWRIFAGGKASIHGFSEDYACLINGLVALYEADLDPKWIERAALLADTLVRDFYSTDSKLFWFTNSESENLIVRKIDLTDDVISSSNSMLCASLQKIGILNQRQDLAEIGATLLNSVRQQVIQYPAWYSNWGRSAQAEAIGILQIECTGPDAIDNCKSLQKMLPSWTVFAAAVSESSLPVFENKFIAGENRIYICQGTHCFEPVGNIDQAIDLVRDVMGYEEF